MGKLFAALIILFALAWLGPMCAKLPDDPLSVAVPPVTLPLPAPVQEHPVTITTYRSRKMFPMENGKYIVSVLRTNKADMPALGVELALSARINDRVVEHAESVSMQTLAARTTSYFGLNISTAVFNGLLDAPDTAGNALEWTLLYRFESDGPGAKRCFVLRALPRRRDQDGLEWLKLGESDECERGAGTR